MNKSYILVTGVSGFIGRHLCPFLQGKGYFVRGVVRNNAGDIHGVDEYVQVENIGESTDWRKALAGVDTVIHLGARVHIMNDTIADPIDAFRKVNVLGTERLVGEARVGGGRQAAVVGFKQCASASGPRAPAVLFSFRSDLPFCPSPR